jgi:hypothetical protein
VLDTIWQRRESSLRSAHQCASAQRDQHPSDSAIRDDRDIHQLPVLADALYDAGCDNVVILSHCRLTKSHPEGCWIVELLLGA